MRISTNMIYDQGLRSMSQNSSDLLNVQAQLSSGKRVTTPSDDPLAAAQAVAVNQEFELNAQYALNRNTVTTQLQLEDATFGSVVNVLQHVMSQINSAGNATLSDNDRTAIATDLESSFQQLLSLANTTDANSQYLFSGFMGGTAAYTATATGAAYTGDAGVRYVQVGPQRQVAVNDIGSSVFEGIQLGTAARVVSGNSANQGTGTFSQPSVTDIADPGINHAYEITFGTDATTVPPTPIYTVTDLTDATVAPVTGNYASGQPIAFGGMSITVTGTPADNDTMTVKPAAMSGTNVFDNLHSLIDTLKQPLGGTQGVGQANLTNALAAFTQQFSNTFDNVTTIRTTIGSRMNEMTALNNIGDTTALAYETQLSNLLDADLYTASSKLLQLQTSMTATQQAFLKAQSLSIFNLL